MAGAMLTPVPSASVIVLREPYEVLMLRRHEKSSFAPNAWVFPGGIAEESDHELAAELGDGSLLSTMRIAGLRETFEETGVWLGGPLEDGDGLRQRLLNGDLAFRDHAAGLSIDLGRLVWTSRWITPVGAPKRFDTYFFLTRAPEGTVASAEQNEIVEVRWISPSEALEAHRARTMQMIFPTLRNLEAIEGFPTIDELIASRHGVTIEPVQPVLVDGKPMLP